MVITGANDRPNPPFTEVFARPINQNEKKINKRNKRKEKGGWIVHGDPPLEYKQWLLDGYSNGVDHYKGQYQKTWEVIK